MKGIGQNGGKERNERKVKDRIGMEIRKKLLSWTD
jgi:hypothetical protein